MSLPTDPPAASDDLRQALALLREALGEADARWLPRQAIADALMLEAVARLVQALGPARTALAFERIAAHLREEESRAPIRH